MVYPQEPSSLSFSHIKAPGLLSSELAFVNINESSNSRNSGIKLNGEIGGGIPISFTLSIKKTPVATVRVTEGLSSTRGMLWS